MLNVLGFPLIFFWVLVNIFHIFSAIHPSLKCLYLKFQNYSLLYNVLVLKITKLYFFWKFNFWNTNSGIQILYSGNLNFRNMWKIKFLYIPKILISRIQICYILKTRVSGCTWETEFLYILKIQVSIIKKLYFENSSFRYTKTRISKKYAILGFQISKRDIKRE